MPFKEKFKKAFRINDGTSATSSLSSATQNKSATTTTPTSTAPVASGALVGRRRPMDKLQRERMDQYSFSDDAPDRKASYASQYSPMGSKLPSRRASSDITGAGVLRSGRGHNAAGSDIQENGTSDSASDPIKHDGDSQLQDQSHNEADIQDGTTANSKAIEAAELSKALSGTSTQIAATGM